MIDEMAGQIWPHLVMMVWAFGAATLLPLSSEVVLAAQIKSGFTSPMALVASATIGNVAGSTFNWWLGRHVRRFEDRRWFPFSPSTIAKASDRYHRFGLWSLVLSWLPIIGDPLTLVAGLLRVPLIVFLPLVAVGKAGRYLVLAGLVAL